MMPGWHRVLVVLLLLPLVATCGGSGGETRVPEYGTFPVPSEPTDPGGTPLGGSPPVPPELSGGVLATFDVSGETFALWIPDSPVAQTLVDAWTGTGPAVSAV